MISFFHNSKAHDMFVTLKSSYKLSSDIRHLFPATAFVSCHGPDKDGDMKVHLGKESFFYTRETQEAIFEKVQAALDIAPHIVFNNVCNQGRYVPAPHKLITMPRSKTMPEEKTPHTMLAAAFLRAAGPDKDGDSRVYLTDGRHFFTRHNLDEIKEALEAAVADDIPARRKIPTPARPARTLPRS